MGRHMLQRELAEIIGVTEDSITNWETNRSQPHYRYYPTITNFLGYCLIALHPMGGWRQTLLNDRLQRGLRRTKYAKMIGIDESTLTNAEQGQGVSRRTETKISEFLK